MRTKWFAVGLLAIAASIIGGILLSRQSATRVATVQSSPEHLPSSRPVQPAAPHEQIPGPEVGPVKETPVQLPHQSQKPLPMPTPGQQPKPSKEPPRDPAARDALALVGVDPEAENYWLDAIFDGSLPDKERDDLMEDLNEVGFSDANNPTADDLPLIVNRLQIIDQVLPYADPFMTGHLLEARKDLANMYAQVTPQ
jgi:hypothetical protein